MAFLHGKSAGVLFNQYNLSAYLNNIDTSRSLETAEVTTFGAGAKAFIPGLQDGTVSLGGLFDGSASAVDETLQEAIGSSGVLSVAEAGFGTIGNRCRLASAYETSYDVSAPVADVVSCSAEFQVSGGLWSGVVLQDLSAETATADKASVDNGASSANGWVANIHCTAVSGTTPTLDAVVEDSADDATFATLGTFTQLTAAGSEQISGTGTVERYARIAQTISGTNPSFTYMAAFARK